MSLTDFQFALLCISVVLVLSMSALVLAVVCVGKAGPTDIFRGGIEGAGRDAGDRPGPLRTNGGSGKQCGSIPQPGSQVIGAKPCAERLHSVGPLDYTAIHLQDRIENHKL